MLKFKFAALKAMPKLFAYRNDVDIYTEDRVADKEFYRTLFGNVLEGVTINDVTPLGCKENVLRAYDNQGSSNGRRRYYIVDGDLDLILGSNRRSEKNLIVLDSYCIENYLIEENGIIELLYLSNGVDSRETHKVRLNFNNWLGYNANALTDLFINLALLKSVGGGLGILSANHFLKQAGRQTILDTTKVEDYTAKVKEEFLNIVTANGVSDAAGHYTTKFSKLSRTWGPGVNTFLRVVSSKDYLLPLLQFRVNFCVGRGKTLIPNSSLKLFLAANCKIDRLAFLKKIIKK